MKTLPIIILLFFTGFCYGQINYYSFGTDSLFTEAAIHSAFDTATKTLPEHYVLIPTIYHRIIKGDSIINFLAFNAQKTESGAEKQKFGFTFKQDSLFLFLNKKLPEFKLIDLKGNTFSSSQLMGKPTLLNYWAIYCAPCVAEIPELNGLKEKYGDKMNFIALTENTCKDDELIQFLKSHPFNYTILQNAENYKKTLKISAIPRNLFIDKEGYIRFIQGNYPYEINQETGEKIYSKNNSFVKIMDGLIKKQ